MERRLAAILAADVVGYSRLMEVDEEATARTLSIYREIIEGLVASHHGRVFGSAGDSVIAEFASPVEAVRCAVDIQGDLEPPVLERRRRPRAMSRLGTWSMSSARRDRRPSGPHTGHTRRRRGVGVSSTAREAPTRTGDPPRGSWRAL